MTLCRASVSRAAAAKVAAWRSAMGTEFGKRGQEIDAVATGKRIQELRKQRELRVTDISDRMGFYEPQAVYKWMRGESLPTLQNMFCLSQILETSMEDIIRCTEPERENIGLVNRNNKERGDGSSRLPLPLLILADDREAGMPD